ncbi:MAG: hypothetical protein ACT4UQ_07030 [Gammaproteobacteria bacterium]
MTQWVMWVSGLLTCTMAYMLFAPQAAMLKTFGTTLEGPLAEIIVRNWAFLIVAGGVLLIYAAFRPAVQPLVLAFTGTGKLVFIALVLAYGAEFLDHELRVAIVTDSIMVVLFAACLFAPKRA